MLNKKENTAENKIKHIKKEIFYTIKKLGIGAGLLDIMTQLEEDYGYRLDSYSVHSLLQQMRSEGKVASNCGRYIAIGATYDEDELSR